MKKYLAFVLILAWGIPVKGVNVPLNYNSTNGAIINPPPGLTYNLPGGTQVNGSPLIVSPTTRMFQPTTSASGTTTVARFNVVTFGDSITAGAGATVQTSFSGFNYQAVPQLNPYPTGWAFTLQTLGFCAPAGTVWPLGMGSETVEQGTSHFYNSQGQTARVFLTNGSSTGTLTATPQFIIPGSIISGTGIATNTTMGNTQVITTGGSTTTSSATLTVANSTGVTSGMLCALLVNPTSILNPLPTNATVSSIPDSTHIVLTASNTAVMGGLTFVFYSPVITLSNAYTGTTGTQTLTSGATLLTGTGTFTANSTTMTTSSTTGLAPSSAWYFPMGSTVTPPGDYFNGNPGTGTFTLAVAAKSSGTVTWFASATIHDAASPTTFYPQNINTTAYLLSPNVTGVPGYAIDGYGMNNSAAGTGTATFATDYAAQIALLVSVGYQVVYTTIPPPALNNTIGENPTLVNQYNANLRTANLPSADLFDIAATYFPTGNVNVPEYFHYSDGVHPSNAAHQAIAGGINDFLFSTFANSSTTVTYPLGGANINYAWLPTTVAQTNQPNLFGTLSVSGGTSGTAQPITVVDTVTIDGTYDTPSTLNVLGGPNVGQGPSGVINVGTTAYTAASVIGTTIASGSMTLSAAGSGSNNTLMLFESSLASGNHVGAVLGTSNTQNNQGQLEYFQGATNPASGIAINCWTFWGVGEFNATGGCFATDSTTKPVGNGFTLEVYSGGSGNGSEKVDGLLTVGAGISNTGTFTNTGPIAETGTTTLTGPLNVTGTTTLATSLTGIAKLTSGVVSIATAGTDYAAALTVQTGTLVSGASTKTVPAGSHPWVQDNAASLTNVGSLVVTVSGTTATITSTNVLDTSPFTLYNAGSQ